MDGAFPVSVMNLFVVLSFLLATTPCLLFHIPPFIFLIQLYLLPSIQPFLFLSYLSHPPPPPSSSVFNYSSEDSSSLQSFSVFPVLSASPPRCSLFRGQNIWERGRWVRLYVRQNPPSPYARLCVSMRGCLHNPHKSPHPLFGLLGKHNGCLSSLQQQIQQR